jgi:hypothetical protein
LPRTLRALASSGWVPASVLAICTVGVLAWYDTPIRDVLAFGVYVALGIAVPGTLWVRGLRGRAAHVSEDLTLGLTAGYAVEIATYIVARAVGLPLLFLAWPVVTYALFAGVPRLRRYWRGSGERAPTWWSWSLAVMLGFLLIYSADTFFGTHHLTGADAPYLDMPYHLALIGELRYHVPPAIPYVVGQPLNYHWFYYAEAAATSWATGIEPVELLYRLAGLPMFVAFVVLTAAAARRLTGAYWGGPVAVAVALFGTVADPFGWTGTPVMDTQTLAVTWISPTNLFGLAMFAATILLFIDLFRASGRVRRGDWLLVALALFGIAGAKASLLPILIVGLLAVLVGVAITRRRIDRRAAASVILAVVAFGLATLLLYRGTTGGLVIGGRSIRSFPVVHQPLGAGTPGLSGLIVPIVGWLVALGLWSFLWAGAYGLLVRRRGSAIDPSILLLLGICAGALGAVTVFWYPGLSEAYYLKGAAGAFGLLVTAGIAAVVPARFRRGPLLVGVVVAAFIGAVAVMVIRAIGPAETPTLITAHLSGVLAAMILPVVALAAVAIIAFLGLRGFQRGSPTLRDAIPLLMIALIMGFSLPGAATLMIVPLTRPLAGTVPVPADGIAAAYWLRDHSDPSDLVATDLHCRPMLVKATTCDARHFWVSGYSERHVLVEGWAYTTRAIAIGRTLNVNGATVPFWDQALLAQNDRAFSAPSATALAKLRAEYGVHWLFADLSASDGEALGRLADLRYRQGNFGVFELR